MTTPLERIWNKPNVTMQEIRQFMSDKRLTSPLSICGTGDAMEQFGDYDTYPDELCMVFMMNNY